MRRQIDPLTGIRGVAAAWVVLLHVQLLTPQLLPPIPGVSALIGAGGLGVDLFFILSGFVISYTYLDRLHHRRRGDVARFLVLRVARIYPAHLATLLLVAALVAVAGALGSAPADERRFSLLSFVMNVFMLQSVPPALSWNDPAWSISAEFGAYLAFPLMVPLLSRIAPRRALLALAVLTGVGMASLWAVVSTGHLWPYWAGYVLIWLRIAICFPVGCLLYVIWRSREPRDWASLGPTLGAVAVAGVVAASVLTPPAKAITLPVLAYPFLAAMIFSLACGGGWLGRWLSTGPMVWSGKISYSVYLVHFPLLLVTQVALERLALPQTGLWSVAGLLAVLALITAAGAILYYAVEEPARRAIKRRAARSATSEPDARTPQPE